MWIGAVEWRNDKAGSEAYISERSRPGKALEAGGTEHGRERRA
jgi:hypothetical protein